MVSKRQGACLPFAFPVIPVKLQASTPKTVLISGLTQYHISLIPVSQTCAPCTSQQPHTWVPAALRRHPATRRNWKCGGLFLYYRIVGGELIWSMLWPWSLFWLYMCVYISRLLCVNGVGCFRICLVKCEILWFFLCMFLKRCTIMYFITLLYLCIHGRGVLSILMVLG